MKAIVSIIRTSQGERVSLLGLGESEAEARQAAYRYLNRGFNDFDEELCGRSLVDVAPPLAALHAEAMENDDPDLAVAWQRAEARLIINERGRLGSKEVMA